MKKKIGTYLAACLAVLLAGVFLWPLPLSEVIHDTSNIIIAIVDTGVENGSPTMDFSNYKIQSNTSEFKQIQAILKKYSYHRSLRTFFSDASTSGNAADYWLQFYVYENQMLKNYFTCGGTKEIIVNDHVYRIGYFGNHKALSMMKEIRDVLEDSEEMQ